MTLSSERVRTLLLPAVRAGESLSEVAVARDASSIMRGLLSVFLPMAIFIAVMVALKVDAKKPIMTAVITVGALASAGLGLVIGGRKVRRYAVGLTSQRLLVAPLADRSGLRVAATWAFTLENLARLPIKAKMVNMGGAGTVLLVGRLVIPDRDHPLSIDFVEALMPGNKEAYYAIRRTLVPGEEPTDGASQSSSAQRDAVGATAAPPPES